MAALRIFYRTSSCLKALARASLCAYLVFFPYLAQARDPSLDFLIGNWIGVKGHLRYTFSKTGVIALAGSGGATICRGQFSLSGDLVSIYRVATIAAGAKCHTGTIAVIARDDHTIRITGLFSDGGESEDDAFRGDDIYVKAD
jgi:hypothetical protein